jgi:hypothetical protein
MDLERRHGDYTRWENKKGLHRCKPFKYLVGRDRFELSTYGLRVTSTPFFRRFLARPRSPKPVETVPDLSRRVSRDRTCHADVARIRSAIFGVSYLPFVTAQRFRERGVWDAPVRRRSRGWQYGKTSRLGATAFLTECMHTHAMVQTQPVAFRALARLAHLESSRLHRKFYSLFQRT